MYRIAICDDEPIITSQVENIIYKYADDVSIAVEVKTFSSAEELYKKMKEGQGFNLIFLDIEMGDMNGVEVARKIRSDLKDYRVEIVYISGNDGYDRELFDVSPLHFIPKPIDPELVNRDISLAIERAKQNERLFTYKKGGETYKVLVDDIIYFEGAGRETNVITIGHQDRFYGTMNEIESKLRNNKFIRIHKSYLINYRHISKISYEFIEMSNGIRLSISQPRRKEVRSILMKTR